MTKNQHNIISQDTRERIEAWWSGSSLGRPAVLCRIVKPANQCSENPAETDMRSGDVREMDPAFHVAQAKWAIESHHFPAETLPGVFPVFGSNLVIPGVFAGGQLTYSEDTSTTWINPMADVYERDLGAFDCEHPICKVLCESIKQMAAELGDRALISSPILLDGLTTLSLLREPGPLCIDLIERPDDVKRVAARLDQIAIDAHRHFYALLEDLDCAQTITWCDIWAPGRAEMVQCDFGIMLSPDMYEKFALPGLQTLTEYMDYSCYHLDGTAQTRFLDLLCKLPKLHGIQWNPEPPAEKPPAWIDFFREVRRRGKSLWILCDTVDMAIHMTKELGPDGLMLSIKPDAVKGYDVERFEDEVLGALARASK